MKIFPRPLEVGVTVARLKGDSLFMMVVFSFPSPSFRLFSLSPPSARRLRGTREVFRVLRLFISRSPVPCLFLRCAMFHRWRFVVPASDLRLLALGFGASGRLPWPLRGFWRSSRTSRRIHRRLAAQVPSDPSPFGSLLDSWLPFSQICPCLDDLCIPL